MIIILVALDKFEIDKESSAYSIPMDRRAVRPARARGGAATDAINSATDFAGVHGDTLCTQSAMVTGMSPRSDRSSAQLSEASSEGKADCAEGEAAQVEFGFVGAGSDG